MFFPRHLFMLLSICMTINAARTPSTHKLSRSETKIEAHGLSFKSFYKMESLPVQPLRAASFERTDGYGNKSKFEVYNFDALWKQDQTIAAFANNAITLSIYSLQFLKPECKNTFNYQGRLFVDKSEYKQNTKALDTWSEDEQLKWFQSLTKKSAALEDKFKITTNQYTQKWLSLTKILISIVSFLQLKTSVVFMYQLKS